MSSLLGAVLLLVVFSALTYPIRNFVSERVDARRYRKALARAARASGTP